MKKLLAILLALILVLALAVPTFAEEIVVFESEAGDTMSGSDAYLDPWGSFAEGPFWGADHDAFPGLSISEIKKYANQGDVKFCMLFSCTGFATWSGNNGPIARFNAWDEGAYDAPFSVVAQGDNMYLATVKFDDVAAKYIAVTGDEELAGVVNMAIQLWSNEFKLYKAWVETPEEEIVITDEQVYTALEKQVGSLDGVSGGQQVMSIPVVNNGETVVVRIKGTTDGPFRYWLSKDTWTACSGQPTVSDTEIDLLVEITATADGANEIQFKGPYGGELNNLTLSYIGVFKGTMAEYDAAFAAKKAELIEEAMNAGKSGKNTGYISTGDDSHMIMINGAVITTAHEYDENNVCVYCNHVGEGEEIIIEVTDPVESTTDEEEDVTVDVEEPADEPAVEENPKTGLALAIVPMIVAAAAVVISKR